MKKILAIICTLSFMLTIATASYAVDLQKNMRNYLGRGYSEASQSNRIQAKKHFRKAFDLAAKLKDWGAMIDAAGGLLALGDREDALSSFDKVNKLNKKLKDWRASIALAYNYLAFPKGLIDKNRAIQSAENAEKYASEKTDWRGLLESAKLFDKLEMRESFLQCLGAVKDIGVGTRSHEAMVELAGYYKKLGDVKNSQEAIKLAEEYKSDADKIKTLPGDFKPYGESVAAPKKIDTQAQIAERETADKEITAKIEYLAKSEEDKKREMEYYVAYDDYYDYPYYYRYYSIYDNIAYLPPDWLNDWACYNLNHYRLADDGYVFIGW